MNTLVDTRILFNEQGICNYCLDFGKAQNYSKEKIANHHFQKQINRIKKSNSSTYDCILGISGGTDSSYVAHLLHQEGLKVLLVHCDNGWDTELALSNLEKIKQKTGFDLIIRRVDKTAFYSAQKSFLKARVVDIELLSDHINLASIYEVAYEKKIPWIVTGENINTEFFMPKHWVHNKNDLRQIEAINQLFEKADTSSFPKLGPFKKYYIDKTVGINYFRPLDSIHYNKDEAHELLKREFDWQEHGGKHFESYFTIFFQCYILPQFFNIDKRIPHLSNLICSGVLTKAEAEQQLAQPILKKGKLAEIKSHVFSKMHLTERQFLDIMSKPIALHNDYKTYFIYNKTVQKVIHLFR